MADGTAVEPTKRAAHGDQATRRVRIQDTRGQVHAIEVTPYGWKVLILIDAASKLPLAVEVRQSKAPETSSTQAWSRKPAPIWPASPACTTSSLIAVFGIAAICRGLTAGSPPRGVRERDHGRDC